ncbi:hypothetical protein [Pantoea sp. A4]|uniref:hypothetical protein n=1 Tax=Pantoea sp. A4 TaxID=1225184 RepID=UPI000380B0DF|nr:hypothetical protein [Pantoea sp. A4]
MTNLFDDESTDIFSGVANEVQTSGYNIEQMVAQLVAEGYSPEESGAAVLHYIQQQAKAQHSVNGSAMKLRSDKERAEYMRNLRSQVEPTVWIPPQMREQHASEQRIEQAQQEFVQRMKERGTSAGMMRSSQAAIDFFRKP